MLQTMGPNMDPSISTMILSDIARLKRMPVLAEKLRTWQPTPDPLAEKIKELEVEKLEAEIAKLRSEAQANAAKAQETTAKTDLANLDYLEQESGTKHERDLEKQAGQARGNQDLQVTKALTTPIKEGTQRPDIEAAVGFNEMSDLLRGSNRVASPPVQDEFVPQVQPAPFQ